MQISELMGKEKSPSGGLPPPSPSPSGRYSPNGSSFAVKPESSFPPLTPSGSSSDANRFSHDISRMSDNPPKTLGHRRAHSEILTLPDDLSFDSDLGVVGAAADGPSFSDDTDEDLLSMYLDMDKFNSSEASSSLVGEPSEPSWRNELGSTSSERPRIRHQHSQSMDGTTSIKPELLMSGSNEDAKKRLSAAKLSELALIDPKRAKRIWANRQSAARSKERKMRYIAELERKVQTLQTEATSLSAHHDISRMSDNPPKTLGHRRAHSEILTLPDDLSFDSDLGVVGAAADGPSFSDDTDEDLLSMYLDMDKFNSSEASSSLVGEPSEPSWRNELGSTSSERPRIRHQHSQSMDGTTSIKPELLMSGSNEDAKKRLSAAKLSELALIDPKRAKRIWANRQSAARSKERKMRYIAELERKVQTLQTEATSLSAQLTLLQRDTNGLSVENNELKLRVQSMEQQVHLQDTLNEALKEEVQHLKVLTGQGVSNASPDPEATLTKD
ncbi:hypothetical protein F2Q69_00058269 [Brassica cretica]|uniref:BZIP domain-containing protein n=1 Tax=Brassica cretica TaxID=69181 RepID=A0A8S9RRP7_BRACR|nr:hypothetical protein F2Q69_00058269 [Brassica cretica]